MEIGLENLSQRKIIHDGILPEEGKFPFDFYEYEKVIKCNVCYDKWITFSQEQVNLQPLQFNLLVNKISVHKSGMFQYYKSPEGLKTYFEILHCESNCYLAIISFGEIQPGRFRIVLEGIWRVKI